MKTNLELYKVFYYVAKNNSITRAANELMVSQPAISKSIKVLERDLDTVLFTRNKNGVSLNNAGEVLCNKIKKAMELIISAEEDLKSINNMNQGTINIGAGNTIMQRYLMPFINEFHQLYPNINVIVHTVVTPELIKRAQLGLVSVFCGKIDPGKIAAFGHSQGGRSSVNAAASDARIGCVVSIAGSSYTSEAQKLSAPALFLTGTKDVVVLSSLWVEPAYKSVTGPAVYASLKNGIHTTCILDSDKYIDYCAGWFDAWLRNDADAMGQFKPGGALSKDVGWTKYASKNLTDNGITGSVFSGGTLWKAIALVELLVIIAGAAVILARRKGQKSPA